jgi:hypothetical protein
MTDPVAEVRPGDAWTLRKAVTALAIAPQSESLTRVGRMAFNVMIYLSQKNNPDPEGWWSAPISQIVHGFGSTTRDSPRVIDYIERMARTSVRWYPLSPSDASFLAGQAVLVPGEQASLEGIEQPKRVTGDELDGTRVFTLLSEARFFRRFGEAWVQWYFAPSIREMLIEPVRWAQIDLQELATLSRYASVALYEICSRYKNAPGGLTNRATTEWWVNALRTDPKETTREWRKFKNETLKPSLAEINQRTSLEVKVIEYKQGRAVTEIQFHVRKKQSQPAPEPPDLAVIDKALSVGIKERELDGLVDMYGEAKVKRALEALEARMRVQLKERVHQPLNYLKRILKSDSETGALFHQQSEPGQATKPTPDSSAAVTDSAPEWLQQRMKQLNDEIDALSPEELEHYVARARALMGESSAVTPALQKRLDAKQYGSPMIRQYIRAAYAKERYGSDWKIAPCA